MGDNLAMIHGTSFVSRKVCLLFLLVFCLGLLLGIGNASAISNDQRKAFRSGIKYFNVNPDQLCSASSSSGGGAFGSDQVIAFASLSIASTWNISDNTAEQWFLSQAGARATKTKFGLTASNIGEITAAVKAEGVSPVFFYAYTVNEGGGAGGFINHYRGDAPGGGVGNAQRDAKYLADQSKVMNSQPSWIDAGNPVDFVPQDVKTSGNESFKSMPEGTIGRAYIPATAATTWEVYYPNGLKKEYNQVQNYGAPLSATMQNIQKMGGNPTQGGTTVQTATAAGGCSGSAPTITGAGMEKAINWAKTIAANNGYGYDQSTRTSGWDKWQSDPSCTTQCGSFDCSSFVSAALTTGGYFQTNPNFNTGNEPQGLEQAGFTKVGTSAATSADLKVGDILIASGHHTAIYIGNDQMVEAAHNENRGASGGQIGDQPGDEIRVRDFYNYPWDMVYRAAN